MRRQQSVLIGDILYKDIPADSELGRGLRNARIKAAYRKAVGSAAASATTRTTFKDGVLICKISSSVLRMHLDGMNAAILKAVNSEMGTGEVKSIKFT